MCGYADVMMCGCADMRMCGCDDVMMCGCADVRILLQVTRQVVRMANLSVIIK